MGSSVLWTVTITMEDRPLWTTIRRCERLRSRQSVNGEKKKRLAHLTCVKGVCSEREVLVMMARVVTILTAVISSALVKIAEILVDGSAAARGSITPTVLSVLFWVLILVACGVVVSLFAKPVSKAPVPATPATPATREGAVDDTSQVIHVRTKDNKNAPKDLRLSNGKGNAAYTNCHGELREFPPHFTTENLILYWTFGKASGTTRVMKNSDGFCVVVPLNLRRLMVAYRTGQVPVV